MGVESNVSYVSYTWDIVLSAETSIQRLKSKLLEMKWSIICKTPNDFTKLVIMAKVYIYFDNDDTISNPNNNA